MSISSQNKSKWLTGKGEMCVDLGFFFSFRQQTKAEDHKTLSLKGTHKSSDLRPDCFCILLSLNLDYEDPNYGFII